MGLKVSVWLYVMVYVLGYCIVLNCCCCSLDMVSGGVGLLDVVEVVCYVFSLVGYSLFLCSMLGL